MLSLVCSFSSFLLSFSDSSVVDPHDIKSPSSSLSTVSSSLLSQSLRNSKLWHLEQSVKSSVSSSAVAVGSQKQGFYFGDKFYSVTLQEKNLIIGKVSTVVLSTL
jgi:hypothetical protein